MVLKEENKILTNENKELNKHRDIKYIDHRKEELKTMLNKNIKLEILFDATMGYSEASEEHWWSKAKRIWGKDLLKMETTKSTSTYWIKRNKRQSTMKKQF